MRPTRIGGQGCDHPVGIALYDTMRDVVIRPATEPNVAGRQGTLLDASRLNATGSVTGNTIIYCKSFSRSNRIE